MAQKVRKIVEGIILYLIVVTGYKIAYYTHSLTL